MKNRLLRLLSIALALALLLGAMPEAAWASSNLSIRLDSPEAGSSFKVSWQEIDGAEHYEYSAVDTTGGGRIEIYQRKQTSKTSFKIPAEYMKAGHSYRVWVGAIVNGNYDVLEEHQDLREFTVPSCSHRNEEEFIYEETYFCRANDEETHNIVYTYDYRCEDCGEMTTQNWYRFSEDLPHDFNSKDICRDCGFEYICSHSNVRESIRGQQGSGTSISDTEHRITWLVYLICNGCDEIASETTKTETLPHQLDNNGDCTVCDYRAACSHSQTEIRIEKTSYTTEDASCHFYNEIGHIICSNANCGKEIEPYFNSERQNHSFSGRICQQCSYQKAEELTISVSRGQSGASTGDTISASVTAKGGSGSYNFAWKVYCDGALMHETDYSYPSGYSYTATQAGSWTFRAYVRDKNTGEEKTAETSAISVSTPPCPHPSVKKEHIRTETIKMSDSKHEVRTYYSKVCSDCLEVLSSGSYDLAVEDHRIENGSCICGYLEPKGCEHTSSVSRQIDTRIEQYDHNRHRIVSVFQDVCANSQCGAILTDRREKEEFVNHAHDSSGRCACGHVISVETEAPCDHAPAETVSAPSYSPKDESVHSVSRTYAYKCACGTVDYSETKITTEQHSFSNNVCGICGYQKKITPTLTPTAAPTAVPTATPTTVPTAAPTAVPTTAPTAVPTAAPTTVPTTVPTAVPTTAPTAAPTAAPTEPGCDHRITSSTFIGQSEQEPANEAEHRVYQTYQEKCDCGYVNSTVTKEVLIPHELIASTMSYELHHEPKRGHRLFYKCSCGAHPLSGGSNPTAEDYYSYMEELANSNKCEACRIIQIQTRLNEKGYNAGTVDGLWGKNTRNAMNSFREKEMNLGPIDYYDEATRDALLNGPLSKPDETQETAQEAVQPDEKKLFMDESINFIERSTDGKSSSYNQVFSNELRTDIAELSEGTLANIYDSIAGDAAAIISTSQADFYVDTLMKQCADVNSDSDTLCIRPTDFKMLCNILDVEDAAFNKMLEKWTEDRWTDKYGNIILTKAEFKKEMKKYEFKAASWLGTSIEVGSYMWECLYDYSVYSAAFNSTAAPMIESAVSSMQTSSINSATLASRYIKQCETEEGRLLYIVLKNANIADVARDKAFDVLLSNPSLQLAYESSTLFNDVMFGTSQVLKANHGTHWSIQLVDDLHAELTDSFSRYKQDPSEENYNECLSTYSLYVTYMISAYDSLLETMEINSSSLAAKLTGNSLTAEEKALINHWKLLLDLYSLDVENALENHSIDSILKLIEEAD